MKPKVREQKQNFNAAKKIRQWVYSVNAKCTLIVIVAVIFLLGLFYAVSAPEKYDLRIGSISRYTITATKDVVDEVTTEERRQAAANAVEPTYHLQEGVNAEVLRDLTTVLKEISTVQQYGLSLFKSDESEQDKHNRKFTTDELSYAKTLITHINLTDYQLSTIMRAETNQIEEMTSVLLTVVDNSLNTTIREGQVNQSIDTMLQIAGYRVDTSLYQNVVPTVLRTCVKPNMVIETESTELARTKARESVEPVIYLQGQNIIREGERVSANQMQMLRALGLIGDNRIDWAMYAGAFGMIIAAFAVLLILLYVFSSESLHDLRKISVIMATICINMILCYICVRNVNVFLAPMAITAILITALIGPLEGIAGGLCVSLLACVFVNGSPNSSTSQMTQMLVLSIINSLTAAIFLKHKPHRLKVVICGFVVAAVGFIGMLSVGIMTSSNSASVMTNGLMCMAAGVLSGVVAVGLQPVIETIFNLATPAKLLELSNPNHPLLRRLLIEASGTYHHSIIVANLSEAAAEKINANPLLARTGAYFHDIGKIQRPLYFKQNQMGDNPHDRTDPYVSAAIVTTHTRDGLKLALKHHLPPEIQKIIIEHHGNTPVMFFYHKACQLANGKTVDINDFRYDGGRPTSKESAIVMLADTVEAAVRSMPDPTPQGIDAFIRKLVQGKLDDGQLNDSPLTLRDINNICTAFASVLNGVFHERIEYPNMEPHQQTSVVNLSPSNVNDAEKDTIPAEEKAD